MRISQTAAHEALQAILDPEGAWWWTAFGLITLTDMARVAAGLPVKGPSAEQRASIYDGAELRYWITVYRLLSRACERSGWDEARAGEMR